MYNLKRLLNSIIHDSSVVGAPANIPPIRDAAKEALAEVEKIEQEQLDAPQEMRDFYAGAAMIGILARPLTQDDGAGLTDYTWVTQCAWTYSDFLMEQRMKRLASRRKASES